MPWSCFVILRNLLRCIYQIYIHYIITIIYISDYEFFVLIHHLLTNKQTKRESIAKTRRSRIDYLNMYAAGYNDPIRIKILILNRNFKIMSDNSIACLQIHSVLSSTYKLFKALHKMKTLQQFENVKVWNNLGLHNCLNKKNIVWNFFWNSSFCMPLNWPLKKPRQSQIILQIHLIIGRSSLLPKMRISWRFRKVLAQWYRRYFKWTWFVSSVLIMP